MQTLAPPSVLRRVVAVYVRDAQDRIFPLYTRVRQVFRRLSSSYEIVFLDDASRDRSAELIGRIERVDPNVRHVHFRAPKGRRRAYRAAGGASARLDAAALRTWGSVRRLEGALKA